MKVFDGWPHAVGFFLALAVPFHGHAETYNVTVPWTCPQTSKVSGVPAKAMVLLSVDLGTGTLTSGDFDRIREAASKDRGKDYFECMRAFMDSAMDALIFGAPNRVAAHGEAPEEKAATQLQGTIADYGAQALRNGAVPPFTPGQEVREPMTDEERRWLRHEVEFLCLTRDGWVGDRKASRELVLEKSFIEKDLPELVKGLAETKRPSADCLRSIAAGLTERLLDLSLSPSQCMRSPAECEARKRSIEDALSKFGAIEPLAPFLTDLQKRIESCSELEMANQALLTLATDLRQAAACVQLKPGDSSVVRGDKGSTVPSSYLLKRIPDENGKPVYKAILNPSFILPGKGKSSGLQEYYTNKAKGCIAEVGDKLRGPSGEKLILDFYDGPEEAGTTKTEQPPKWGIEIDPSLKRAHSAAWTPEISCSTILHELFHVMGLVDEYAEIQMGVTINADGSKSLAGESATLAAYDCRALGPVDSLMRDPSAALKAIQPGKTVISCRCDAPAPGFGIGMGYPMPATGGMGGIGGEPGSWTDAQKQEFERMAQKAMEEQKRLFEESKAKCTARLQSVVVNSDRCPAGTTRVTEDITYKDWDTYSLLRTKLANAERGEVDEMGQSIPLRIESKDTRASLLYPAQFRAITQPGCTAANRHYFQCGREAYKTSATAYGPDRCAKGLPEECFNGGWLK